MHKIYLIDVTNRDGVQTAKLGLSKLEKTMINIYLNEMGVFQSEAFCPRAALAGGVREHGALFPQTGDYFYQGGIGLTILDTPYPEFINGFQDFHIHRVIA